MIRKNKNIKPFEYEDGFTLMKAKRTEAFTLIELLVVISIMGLLLALSVYGIQSARRSSHDAKRKSDLEQIRSGLEMYKSDCNSYPAALGLTLKGDGSSSNCPTSNVYIDEVPVDPKSDGSYDYDYVTDNSYTLRACLESPDDSQCDRSNGSIVQCTSGGYTGCRYTVHQ